MSLLVDMGFSQAKEFYEYKEMVAGNIATVFMFFNDYDISRGECITMATKFMKGEYKRIEINMYTLEIVETNGDNKVNPR